MRSGCVTCSGALSEVRSHGWRMPDATAVNDSYHKRRTKGASVFSASPNNDLPIEDLFAGLGGREASGKNERAVGDPLLRLELLEVPWYIMRF